jgi:hypothetical protein
MASAQDLLDAAALAPPRSLRDWIWTLAPSGQRVLAAAAAAVVPHALREWPWPMAPVDLLQAREAIEDWLSAPCADTQARVDAIVPVVARACEQAHRAADEASGSPRGHDRAAAIASLVEDAVRAAAWTEETARVQAAGDAAEERALIAAGPALHAASAIERYAALVPARRDEICRWIAELGRRLAL